MKTKGIISIIIAIILIFTTVVVLDHNSLFSDPQKITISVADQNNIPLSNVSVQGIMLVPPTMGNGLVTVFLGSTDQYGISTITNLSIAKTISQAWLSYQGGKESNISSPDILLFITYQNNKGVFFTTSSVHLTTNEILNGKSYNTFVKIDTNANPDFPMLNISKAVEGPAPLLGIGKPLPPSHYIAGPFYWVLVQKSIYPSSPGNIPIGWIDVQGSGLVNCTLAMSLFSQTNEYLNIGIATDVNVPGATVGYKAGGSLWQTSQSYGGGDNTNSTSSGSAYIYVVAQVEGGLYQLAESTLWGWYYFDNYTYETDAYNIQVDSNGNIEMGDLSGLPPQISSIELNYSYNLFTVLSPGQYNKTYSTEFVKDYTNFDTNWINIGIPVGSILKAAGLLSDVLTPVASLACALSFNTQTTTVGLAYAKYGVNSQNYLDAYVMLGNTIYNLGNGASGIVPLMGIDIYGFSSGGGGGCVLNNTYITLANREQVPVQDLKVGEELLSYNYNTGQYTTAEVINISATNVTNVIDINNGSLYMSGLEDQPMFVKMQDSVIETTTLGQLNYGMQVYVPLLLKWIPITSIKLLTGSFTVYDIRTTGNVDYIANGILIIPK